MNIKLWGGSRVEMEGKISNDVVRSKLLSYVEEFGVTQRHIAKKAGLSDPTMSFFIRGTRDLSEDRLKVIWGIVNK